MDIFYLWTPRETCLRVLLPNIPNCSISKRNHLRLTMSSVNFQPVSENASAWRCENRSLLPQMRLRQQSPDYQRSGLYKSIKDSMSNMKWLILRTIFIKNLGFSPGVSDASTNQRDDGRVIGSHRGSQFCQCSNSTTGQSMARNTKGRGTAIGCLNSGCSSNRGHHQRKFRTEFWSPNNWGLLRQNKRKMKQFSNVGTIWVS